MSLRTLPMRMEICEGESADSWIEALSRRYRTSPRATLALLGIHPVDYVSTLLGKTDAESWDRAAQAARLDPARLRGASAIGLGRVTPVRSSSSRYCPQCLAESGGRWQLAWRLNWSVVCIRHRVLLAEGCPACGKPQRTRIAAGREAVEPATCTNKQDGDRCGTDLTSVESAVADVDAMEAQQWIEGLLAELAGPRPAAAAQLFTDLPIVTSWLARATEPGLYEGCGGRGHGVVPDADPAQTARFLLKAKAVLADDDETAIGALKQVTALLPTLWRNPPPGMGHIQWRTLGPVFPNRYLRACDTDLQVSERLRMRTATAQAARTSSGPSDRSSMLPQLLWPEWTGRLLPPTGFLVEQFRAVISTCILMPGSLERGHALIAAQLNPHLGRNQITMTMQGIAEIDGEASLRPVLIVLCRLADHLDQHGAPIDYRRRRQITANLEMSWSHWRDLACGAGAHPGDPVPTGRLRHAQRHLHQLLAGSDLTDPAHPLTFRNASDRSHYREFTARLSTPLRRAFHQEAERILAEHGIDEPVTWHPPLHLAEGLQLPGIDIDLLDLDLIRRVVIDGMQPLGAAAQRLGIHIEHVYTALERLDRPERTWSARGKPEAWKREQILSREYLEREYVGARRSLREIAEQVGTNRAAVAAQARRHGIDPDQGPRKRIALDEAWLREQYVGCMSSTTEIAQELGLSPQTIANALKRMGVQLRPAGVISHRQMRTRLDRRISREIRAAVEGGLHGWQRLRRFQIAMAFPSLDEAGRYLDLPTSGLVHQLQRLERDIGDTLFTRSGPGRPQAPTARGWKLLKTLDRSYATTLMNEALGASLEPMPDRSGIKAAVNRFHQPQKKPGPLKPFDDIAVARTRITGPTLHLLQDLLAHGDPHFYGQEVLTRTGIDAGTLYPALRRLRDAGWLTSWPEPEREWLDGAPPGCGPGRRRTYYALTPEGRRAAEHEIEHRSVRPKKRQEA